MKERETKRVKICGQEGEEERRDTEGKGIRIREQIRRKGDRKTRRERVRR